ncbi:DUF1569 domain-containing protein [Rubrolithibacter danxiaensis]|uniref:DUF1569 domain-containing protein n=1 Tax=Rubrolithibacter danxiaensis TaxID=3390805 RepID=UPI003BF79147
MKSIFDPGTRNELIKRIKTINKESTAQWGKMNVGQMLEHCTRWEDMMHGRKKFKRVFLGYLFGKIALRTILKDESPLRRSTPTIPDFVVKETRDDIETLKTKWILLIEEYENFSNSYLIHPFFGRITKEQIGYLVYKHTDHHLRQFNS